MLLGCTNHFHSYPTMERNFLKICIKSPDMDSIIILSSFKVYVQPFAAIK